MTDSETTMPSSVRSAGERILQAGGEVSSRAELLEYLEELATVASAIQHGLRNAAWRGQLTEGAALDERPAGKEIDQRLSARDAVDEGWTPGEAAFGMSVLNVIRLAQNLGDVANTAWTAGIAETTRVRVDEARAHARRGL